MENLNDIPAYFRYWGKAKRPLEADFCEDRMSDTEISEKYDISINDLKKKAREYGWRRVSEGEHYAMCHLLPYHCLDVAAVGSVLLREDRFLRQRMSKAFGVIEEKIVQFLVFLLAVHDLGKFAEAFQQLKYEFREGFWGKIHRSSYDVRHDTLGYLLWVDELHGLEPLYESRPGLFDSRNIVSLQKTLKPLVQAVSGHHGLPPLSLNVTRTVGNYFRDHDVESARLFVDSLGELFEFDISYLLELNREKNWRRQLKPATWQLAGFAVLCDWLGSDASIFQYHDQVRSLNDYWQNIALPRAENAVDKSGILPAASATARSFPEIFPGIVTPTPLQSLCTEIPLPDSPQLFILEDITGSGKTEAAVTLVHRLMAKGLSQGVFVALPTMATANAMYARMAEIYRRLYAREQKPSLILSHSARHLSPLFEESSWQSGSSDGRYGNQEDTATVQCSRWLADNRKKSLLTDVGIGTIDQAILGILPAKHQSLRLFGLANKVLLIDEVHAYDHYMFPLLQTLLRFHARSGGSAILLSATLPRHMRQALVDAWQDGRGYKSGSLHSHDYPLMTHIRDDQSFIESPVASRSDISGRININLWHSETEVMAVVVDSVRSGQCVCWVRNTIHDARSAYQQLQGKAEIDNDRLSLFHSRFALADRLAIEQNIIDQFGKESGSDTRQGRVLIATQVVEQSLDLDFDVLISDLAPIDLLIQRAGRMHRHIRDATGDRSVESGGADERPSPVFHVLSPPVGVTPQQDWYRSLFPKANYVYPHTGYLWRTALLLKEGGWRMPNDARKLIEDVYGGDAIPIPESLEQASMEALGEWQAQTGLAKMNALKLEAGYTLDENAWDDEAKIPTRLAGESTTVYLTVPRNGQLRPLHEGDRYPWDLSSLNVPITKICGVAEDNPFRSALDQLTNDERLFNEFSHVIPVEPLGDRRWQGEVLDGQEQRIQLIYDTELGLLVGEETAHLIQEE